MKRVIGAIFVFLVLLALFLDRKRQVLWFPLALLTLYYLA